MKYIAKKPEPTAFTAWKQSIQETLQRYAEKSTKGDRIWELLSSKIPDDKKEVGNIYYSKEELREELLKEQGYICCYCNQFIDNNHTTIIEHLQAKEQDPTVLTFDYENLLASCNGGQKDEAEGTPPKRYKHCDALRSSPDKSIDNNKNLPITPLNPDCEKRFSCTLEGEIVANSTDAAETIRLLGLDAPKLGRMRRDAIELYI